MADDRVTRRELLKATAVAGTGLTLGGCLQPISDGGMTAATAILRSGYDDRLLNAIETGFDLVPPPDVAGKHVLLKINLVDLPRDNRPIVTDPAVVIAAAQAFRRRGATEVVIADGPALQRDAWQIVDAIGLTSLLREHDLDFIDLNTADMTPQPNAGGRTGIETLYYAAPAWHADVLVSMPKMKTHHWLGASLAMKNLFGMLSGVAYGMPRNAFHLRGPHKAVVDFNLTRPADYAIVDGIVGLEGDGPVRGTSVNVGVLIMGDNAAAVDATATRVMGIRSESISYLRQAAGQVGPILETGIEQRGESIAAVQRAFQLLQHQSLLVI